MGWCLIPPVIRCLKGFSITVDDQIFLLNIHDAFMQTWPHSAPIYVHIASIYLVYFTQIYVQIVKVKTMGVGGGGGGGWGRGWDGEGGGRLCDLTVNAPTDVTSSVVPSDIWHMHINFYLHENKFGKPNTSMRVTCLWRKRPKCSVVESSGSSKGCCECWWPHSRPVRSATTTRPVSM